MAKNANDFQYKVADYLKAKGWDVEISPHYVDLITQKSREIDIIAEKEYAVISQFPQRRANLLVRLFTECKWILPSVSVYLIFLPKDRTLAVNLAQDNDILRQQYHPSLEGFTGKPSRVHHYIQSKEVAKNATCESDRGVIGIYFMKPGNRRFMLYCITSIMPLNILDRLIGNLLIQLIYSITR